MMAEADNRKLLNFSVNMQILKELKNIIMAVMFQLMKLFLVMMLEYKMSNKR